MSGLLDHRRRLPVPPLRSAAVRLLALAASVLAVAALAACGGEAEPAPEREPGTVVWAVGDGADGGEDANAIVDLIARDPHDAVLYLGDVYPKGTPEDFEENYRPTYGRLAGETYPTPGNHEYDYEDPQEGYYAYWQRERGKRMPPWYSFKLGGWEFLSLNSEEPVEPGSPQHTWLQAQLSEPGTCRVAFFHAARYSATPEHHGDNPDLEPLWDALEGHATVVLSAHDHNMQRFKPTDGMTQFVSGAGGHFHYDVEEQDDRLAWSNDDNYGALRLELRPGVAEHRFVLRDGRVVDRGTIPCRR
ncbi:MAG: metallophosphoesterase [Actinomycetota bacterium]|nr:metallophosphoesterase [Actinomycetota bacterium]